MKDALDAIHQYYKAFSTLDLDTCVPFFALPCMFVGFQGTFAVANREDLAKVLGPTFEMLRSKNFQRSEFGEPQFTSLTETAALVRGVAVRYRSTGAELDRVPIAYLMHHIGAAWKIAVIASALRFPTPDSIKSH